MLLVWRARIVQHCLRGAHWFVEATLFTAPMCVRGRARARLCVFRGSCRAQALGAGRVVFPPRSAAPEAASSPAPSSTSSPALAAAALSAWSLAVGSALSFLLSDPHVQGASFAAAAALRHPGGSDRAAALIELHAAAAAAVASAVAPAEAAAEAADRSRRHQAGNEPSHEAHLAAFPSPKRLRFLAPSAPASSLASTTAPPLLTGTSGRPAWDALLILCLCLLATVEVTFNTMLAHKTQEHSGLEINPKPSLCLRPTSIESM